MRLPPFADALAPYSPLLPLRASIDAQLSEFWCGRRPYRALGSFLEQFRMLLMRLTASLGGFDVDILFESLVAQAGEIGKSKELENMV